MRVACKACPQKDTPPLPLCEPSTHSAASSSQQNRSPHKSNSDLSVENAFNIFSFAFGLARSNISALLKAHPTISSSQPLELTPNEHQEQVDETLQFILTHVDDFSMGQWQHVAFIPFFYIWKCAEDDLRPILIHIYLNAAVTTSKDATAPL